MKKMMIMAVMMVMTISARAMNYNAAKHSPAPAAKPNNNATWRNTDNTRPNVTSRANGHSNANRQIAQNTSNNSRNSHFGGRR